MTIPTDNSSSLAWPSPQLSETLARLRRESTLVHCITNAVATNFTANVLLAVGASPAMVVTVEEVEEFVGMAGALLVNVGTITASDAEAMLRAASAAGRTGTPWVLDPVAAGVLGYRTGVVRELVALNPSIIRGNASEILAVAGIEGGGKGVDSTASSEEALPAAIRLAKSTGAVVALSGEIDYITDGREVVSVAGGHEIMTKVTGVGCSLGGVMAALLPVSSTPLEAAAAASAIYAEAGSCASRESRGTGSFAVSFLDNLSTIGT